jgi:hypothetical protein
VQSALNSLKQGADYPWDAGDQFEDDVEILPTLAQDWAHYAARGILADLTDRRGIKNGFNNIDEQTRGDIVTKLRQIILVARREARQPFPTFNLGLGGETTYQTYHRGFRDGWCAE